MHDHGEMAMMSMSFRWSRDPGPLWFSGFSTENGYKYATLWFTVFALAVVTVLLRQLSTRLQSSLRRLEAFRAKKMALNAVFCLVPTAVLALDYLLMLAAMTYNAGLFLAVLGGVATTTAALGLYRGGCGTQPPGGDSECVESLGCCRASAGSSPQ